MQIGAEVFSVIPLEEIIQNFKLLENSHHRSETGEIKQYPNSIFYSTQGSN